MYDLDPLIKQSQRDKIRLPLIDAEINYYPGFIPRNEASDLFEHIKKKTAWQQDEITIFGKTYPQPRLTALYGNNGKTYSYSGITMRPHPFDAIHLELLEKLKSVCATNFTTVLLNLYRDGSDSNGWHSDDEPELGKMPVIASLSFGAERVFHFKHKGHKEERYKFTLQFGSLLLMEGTTQHFWQHQLPKSRKVNSPRINLTFRKID